MALQPVCITNAPLVMRMKQCRNVVDRENRIARAARQANVTGMRDGSVWSSDSVTFHVSAGVPQSNIKMFEQLLCQEFTPRLPVQSRYSTVGSGRPYGLQRY